MLRIILILFLTLFLVSCGSNDTRNAASILGKEPVKDAVLLENQSDALILWLKKGYKGMTVVHVSARDDFEFVPEAKIDKIKKLGKDKKFDELARLRDTGEKSLFTGSNYLYSAAKLGVAKEIYWVMPFRMLGFSDAERRVKAYLKTAASIFPSKDIDGMKLKGGCLKGKLFKTQVNICNIDTLPPIKEPVILDMDADFFPVFSSDRGISMLRGFKEFFDAMNRRQMRVVSVDVAYSGAGNYLKPVQKYIGMQIVEAVKNPQLLHSPEPPELWTVRDDANSMFLSGQWKELIEFLKEPLKKYPEEPSLIMFRAFAQVYLGKYDAALDNLEGLCRRDKTYCYGINYAGQELTELKKFNEAELFFKKASELKHK